MDRRAFLKGAAVAAAGLALPATVWRSAMAAPTSTGYGPLGEPDRNGIRLPRGFRSRVIARSGLVVAATGYVWHALPDGGACFPTPDRGWVYVSNSEVPAMGGASAVRFAVDGTIIDAYQILSGTTLNCAGGPTPWNTWLSCEEFEQGRVWECDPYGRRPAVVRPALGTFVHEAAAVDPVNGHVFLTEDHGDGRFYRFVPDVYPNLSSGTLQVAAVDAAGGVRWLDVPNPNPLPRGETRYQVPESTPFAAGEGCWYHGGFVYFTTKNDNRVWVYDTGEPTVAVLYDDDLVTTPVLRGVDNITVASNGEIIVAEDGDDQQLCLLRGTEVVPIAQLVDQTQSELTGPAFDPSGRRLYFSSQRGASPAGIGITYEITGPFRT